MALLCPDAEVVLLVGEVDLPPVVVGVEDPGGPGEELEAAGWRFPVGGAADLHHLDIPLGLSTGGAGPGEGQLVAGLLLPCLQDHVVASVGPADHRRTGSITLRSEPGLYTAAPAVWVSVPRVGSARPGDDELGKVQPGNINTMIPTNQSTASGRVWTNERSPHCPT